MKKCALLFPHYVPLTARFQLVENALNDLHQVTFCNITAFCRNYSAIMNVEYQELINVILRKKAQNDILYQNLYVSVYVTS